MKTVLPLLGEYLGTFLLVLVILSSTNPIFIGVTFIVILFLTLPLSGGLLNPVLVLVNYLNGKLGWRESLLYVSVQTVAAVSSYYTYSLIT